MDYTGIITAVITLITVILSSFVIPLIKQKCDSEKLKKWKEYVAIAVRAAEQIYSVGDGKTKKDYVFKYLFSKGIKFDTDTVNKMIESAVLLLHKEFRKDENNES